MSAEANKAIARRYIEEVWNSGNLAAIDELTASNFVDHRELSNDSEGVKDYVMAYLTAFPDAHFTIEELIAEGDMVVMRWNGQGTHQGELMGMAPTGITTTISGISVMRIAAGRLVEAWTSWDRLGFLQQLGVLPVPEQVRQVGA